MSIKIDAELSIPVYSPVCVLCRHLRLDKERSCAAFPGDKAIPLPIWSGENSHMEPYPGDNGIRFERFANA